jgi:hypothetical protein
MSAALALAWPAEGATSPSGSFQAAIPIEVPPYHGLQPQLAFEYDSSAGNGLVGVGWQLGGLSQIRRAGPGRGVPLFTDPGLVVGTALDAFSLDGLELLPRTPSTGIGSPSCLYSVPGEVGYTGRAETFSRISFNRSLNEWHVWSTTGVKRTYRQGHTVVTLTLDWDLASV